MMKRVYIIQPAVPKYRIPFFDKISNKYNLIVISNKKDFLGVSSVEDRNYIVFGQGFTTFLKKAYWHNNLPLIKPYKKGDTVIINGNPRILNYMILMIILKLRGIQVVWWGHGWSAGSHGILAKVRLNILKIADKRVFYTDDELNKINLRKSFALNNGLCSTQIKLASSSFQCDRYQRISLLRKFKFIFIGRLTDKSKILTLLEALNLAPNNVYLKIIGDGPLLNCVKDYVLNNSLSDRIEVVGAVFDEESIAKEIHDAHFFVYPGSIGLSLIHAFNYGLPALIHNNSEHHMPEFAAFKPGVNGFTFEQDNYEDLSSVMKYISNLSVDELKKLSSNSLETVTKSFNVDDMFQRFVCMIED